MGGRCGRDSEQPDSKRFLTDDGRFSRNSIPKRSWIHAEAAGSPQGVEAKLLTCYLPIRLSGNPKRDEEGPNRLKKDCQLSPEFEALVGRNQTQNHIQVEFTTDDLVHRAVQALSKMQKVELPG